MKRNQVRKLSMPFVKVLWLLVTVFILGGLVTLSTFAAPSAVEEKPFFTWGDEVDIDDVIIIARGISGAGSGNIDPFLQIEDAGDPITEGYNYDTDYYCTGALPCSEPPPSSPYDYPYNRLENVDDGWTHAVNLSAIPQVITSGILYRQILLDINQSGNPKRLSLDEVQIFKYEDNDTILPVFYPPYPGSTQIGYSSGPPASIGLATLLWDLQQDTVEFPTGVALILGDIGGGQGSTDYEFLIPDSIFGDFSRCDFVPGGGGDPVSCPTWIYLYSMFGTYYEQNDGFEQWSHGVYIPLAVTLANFDANAEAPGLNKLDWMTSVEVDTLGFNVYRGADQEWARAEKIAGLITPHGAFNPYTFEDADVQRGKTYYYWLEALDINGSEVFGPAAATWWWKSFIPMITK